MVTGRTTRSSAPWLAPCRSLAVAIGLLLSGCADLEETPAPSAGKAVVATADAEPVPADAPVPAPAKPRYYDRVVALCIGIDRCRFTSGIPELAFAESDARAVGELLRERYAYEPRYLLGEDATRTGIEEAIAGLGSELGPRDALVVFFAGHGQVVDLPSHGRAGFLVPYDAELDLADRSDPRRWREEAIEMAGLVGRIESLPAQHVLLVADCCCSGFMTKRGSLAERADLQAIMTGTSRSVLAASTEAQAAREDRSTGHGYFTAALLRELERDDAASLTDLFVGVRTRVSSESNKLMLPQMAQLGDGDGEFVFLPVAIPEEEIAFALNLAPVNGPSQGALRGVQERAAKRARQRTTAEEVIDAFQAADYRYSATPAEGGRSWAAKIARFGENASRGDALALAGLYYCFAKGLGTERDAEAAYRSALLAYETGSPAGEHVLGLCLRDGLGTARNERAGEELIERAEGRGFPLSELAVGERLAREKDFARAMPLLEQAASAGVLSAKCRLADLYAEGIDGAAPDPDRAIALIREAADAGLPEAQFQLFEALSDESARKDLGEAKLWLVQAANGGDKDAQATLAREYLQLEGVKLRLALDRDEAEARRWAELASAQGVPVADILLCSIYELGLGVPADAERAKEYCERAVAGNHPAAHFRRGLWWHTGRVYGSTDFEKAGECYRRAAELGHPTACYVLALMYMEDELHTTSFRNAPEVVHWYTQAARLGHEKAKGELPRVFRNYLQDQEGWWTSFVDAYPESAKEMVRLLELDPEAPWTSER